MATRLGTGKATWRQAALCVGEDLAKDGPVGYYAMTPDAWRDWARTQIAVLALDLDVLSRAYANLQLEHFGLRNELEDTREALALASRPLDDD